MKKYITKSITTIEEDKASDYIKCENGFTFSKKSAYSGSFEGWTSSDACMFDVDAELIGLDEAGHRYFQYEVG